MMMMTTWDSVEGASNQYMPYQYRSRRIQGLGDKPARAGAGGALPLM